MTQQTKTQDTDTPLGRQLGDNARSHTMTATQNHTATLGCERLHHLLYSSDLGPNDFLLFLALKKYPGGKHSGSNASSVRNAKPCVFIVGIFEAYQAACKPLNMLGT